MYSLYLNEIDLIINGSSNSNKDIKDYNFCISSSNFLWLSLNYSNWLIASCDIFLLVNISKNEVTPGIRNEAFEVEKQKDRKESIIFKKLWIR